MNERPRGAGWEEGNTMKVVQDRRTRPQQLDRRIFADTNKQQMMRPGMEGWGILMTKTRPNTGSGLCRVCALSRYR